jgi:hypothetical protein
MTNRTIQILGQGYGSTPCTANVTFNGNTVFSGQISTIDSPIVYRFPSEQTNLISFEVPMELSGTFPVTIEFTGTDVFVSAVLANYCAQYNPVYTPADIATITDPESTSSEKLAIWIPLADPALTSEDIAVLETGSWQEQQAVLAQHGLVLTTSTGPEIFSAVAMPQCKTNVQINGVAVAPPYPLPPESSGEYGWEIPGINNVGTFSFDLVIIAGLA